jgi:ArsR family transcriptional regulator
MQNARRKAVFLDRDGVLNVDLGYTYKASDLRLVPGMVDGLKILKEAGLIRGEVDGPRVCYCIEPTALARLKVLVAAL